jgi:hypothetical protein
MGTRDGRAQEQKGLWSRRAAGVYLSKDRTTDRTIAQSICDLRSRKTGFQLRSNSVRAAILVMLIVATGDLESSAACPTTPASGKGWQPGVLKSCPDTKPVPLQTIKPYLQARSAWSVFETHCRCFPLAGMTPGESRRGPDFVHRLAAQGASLARLKPSMCDPGASAGSEVRGYTAGSCGKKRQGLKSLRENSVSRKGTASNAEVRFHPLNSLTC